jgi:hypothetical protein
MNRRGVGGTGAAQKKLLSGAAAPFNRFVVVHSRL